MGKVRRSPKALKAQRQRRTRSFNAALFSMFHGNPNGREGQFILDDGRVISTANIKDPVSKERAAVLATRELWQSDFHQNVNEYCFIRVTGKHYPWGLKRFFSGPKHFFLEETFDFIRRSIIYSTKDIAMMAFNTGRITWVERISRHPPPVAQAEHPPR